MNQNDSNDSSIKSEILSRKFINVDENDMQPDELFLNQITVENIENMDELDLIRALGKATETSFHLVEFVRDCEFFVDENGESQKSTEYVLNRPDEIEVFVEVILQSSKTLHGVTVLETSKLYELTKFHFMNLLITNDCFFDLKEKLDSSSYKEHSLVIDLLDSPDVSLEKF